MTNVRRRNPLGELLAGRTAAHHLGREVERRIDRSNESRNSTDFESRAPAHDRATRTTDEHRG